MRNPETFGDPNSCTSPSYHCAASDSGGVHTNSGVSNNPYDGSMNLDLTAPNWTPTSRSVFTGYRTPGNFPNLTYWESRVNLSSYAARDADMVVQFRFRFGTDFCNGTVGWYLDDVEVYDCKAGAAAMAAKP